MNSHDGLIARDDVSREAIRAHFLRVGKLPELRPGMEVWTENFSGWSRARIIRRVAGGCYLAKLHVAFMGVNKVIVQVKTFGGLYSGEK